MGGVTLVRTRWGYPQTGQGYPLRQDRVTSPLDRTGSTPPHQRQKSEGCYATGGMPLAVTQEDFLVIQTFSAIGTYVTVHGVTSERDTDSDQGVST